MREAMPTNPATQSRINPASNDPVDVYEAAIKNLRAHTYPAIYVNTRLIDEEDEDEGYETYFTCPHCDDELEPENVVLVDIAERETYAHQFDVDDSTIDFSSDDHGEFGDTLYYYHDGCSYRINRISVPDGWREYWS